MKSIYELQQIANRLRAITEVNSISPEDTFGLQSDILEYLADMEQNAEGLGIHKVYASYAAMVADASAPVGSNGKALRFGQLVVIYNSSNTTQAESGNVYAWQKGNTGVAAWLLMGNLGSVLGNPQNGYYVCDTAAATAEKEISATGYVLSVGGSMKIKMANANTADNATLNINSTGVKALYYAGERASANNSWEAGETVEVYYDGTSYYANSVTGCCGSGDGAFDVSAKYPTSSVDGGNTYTLDGALAVLNANLSANKKKGGMSIKFIQSSDNKYVQYRLMANVWSTTVADWQGIDDEPTAGSDNLVKSGGTASKISELEDKTSEIRNEVIETEEESIDIYSNNDDVNPVFHLDENGLNAKNVKSNGKDVLTEHQDISGLATKEELGGKQDAIPQVKKEASEESEDYQSWNSDDYDGEGNGEQYVKVCSNGILAKDFLMLDGFSAIFGTKKSFKNPSLNKLFKTVIVHAPSLEETDSLYIRTCMFVDGGGVSGVQYAIVIYKYSSSKSTEFVNGRVLKGDKFYFENADRDYVFIDINWDEVDSYTLNAVGYNPENVIFKNSFVTSEAFANVFRKCLSPFNKEWSNFDTKEIRSDLTDSCWSWWYYPQVVSYNKSKNCLYFTSVSNDGRRSICQYDFNSKRIVRNFATTSFAAKGKTTNDDHNSMAVHMLNDGRLLLGMSGGHNSDKNMYFKRSTYQENVTDFEDSFILKTDAGTSYCQFVDIQNKIYAFFRSGGTGWAYTVSSDNGRTWSNAVMIIVDSIVAEDNNSEFYCKFTKFSDSVIQMVSYGHPNGSDNNMYVAYLDMVNMKCYKDSALTTFISNISEVIDTKDMRQLTIDKTGYYKSRLFDVYPDELIVSYCKMRNSGGADYFIWKDGIEYKYAYSAGVFAGTYYGGAAFLDRNTIIAGVYNSTEGSDIISSYNISNLSNITKIKDWELCKKEGDIRSVRPICDVNGKAFVYQHGYYNHENSGGLPDENGILHIWSDWAMDAVIADIINDIKVL